MRLFTFTYSSVIGIILVLDGVYLTNGNVTGDNTPNVNVTSSDTSLDRSNNGKRFLKDQAALGKPNVLNALPEPPSV